MEMQYHCFPEPKGPPANIVKIGTILAVWWQKELDIIILAEERNISCNVTAPKAPPSFPRTTPMRIRANLTSLLTLRAVASHSLHT